MNKLEKTDAIIKRLLDISVAVLFVLLVIFLAYMCLDSIFGLSIEQYASAKILKTGFRYLSMIMLVVALLFVAIRVCLSFFVESDEQRDFSNKVDYILQSRKSQTIVVEKTVSKDYNPFLGLDERQQAKVCELFRSLPSNPQKAGFVSMARVAQYLTALQQLGYLDDSDLHNLRLWVKQVSGKQVPPSSAFNEAYPSKNIIKVNRAKKKLQDMIDGN